MTPGLIAVILAGGRGERLGGVIKANLAVGGVRLLERVTAAMGEAPELVLVANGALPPDALGLLPRQVAVPDLASDYGGPLAGLAGAVAWCRENAPGADALVTAAVDTPFLPPGFGGAMAAALGNAAAVIARYAGQDYPTNAAWRLSAIADLPARVRDGTAPHSLRRLAAALGAGHLDWPESHGGDPFANANTPADLAALEARATPR